jgi:hypothetical protein
MQAIAARNEQGAEDLQKLRRRLLQMGHCRTVSNAV